MFGFKHRLQEAVRTEVTPGAPSPAPTPAPTQAPTSTATPAPSPAPTPSPTPAPTPTTPAPTTTDWRKELGGDDEKATKFLSRFTDPKALMKTVLEAQAKISSGELAKPLTKDATPEQVAEYRKANGIPETPADYFKNLPDGLVIGKDDQPVFDAYGKVFHDHNLPPAAVHALTKLYYDQQAEVQKMERQVDQADAQKTTQQLRTEWGNDYAPNMQILDSWLDGLPKDVKAMFKDATLGDGTRMMNSPDVVKFLASQARTLNPAAHLLPAGGAGDMKSVETEIARIEKVMKTDRKAYNNDPKMQEQYLKLLDARIKLQGQK